MTFKREFPNFAPWDAHGMAAHLEVMETKGWQFRGTNWLGLWLYADTEPKTVRYAVAYAPSRKNCRLTPTEEERDLEDICFDAGWRKIAALSRFHIYRNADPNATTLETDEEVRLKTLDRALRGSITAAALLWPIYLALTVWALWLLWQQSPPKLLAAPLLPFLALFPVWMVMESIVPLVMYRRWLKKAKDAAALGEPTPEVSGWKRYRRYQRILTGLVLLLMLAGGKLWMMFVYTVLFAVFAIVRQRLSRKAEDPEGAERRFQNLMFWFVIALFVLNFAFQTSDRFPFFDTTRPLSIADLVPEAEVSGFDYDHYDGLLADYRRYDEHDQNTGKRIYCTVFDRHVPLLEAECDAWFRDYFSDDKDDIITEDPAIWGAEEVWRAGDLWLICWEDRTVTLYTSWTMTDAELAAAAARLAP